MKKVLLVIILLYAHIIISQNQKEYPKINHNKYNGFTKNNGQVIDQNGNQNKKVLYLLNTNGLNVQLKKNGFSYDVYERKPKDLKSKTCINKNSVINNIELKTNNDSIIVETLFHRVDINFLEVSDDLVIKEYEVSISYTNYYNIPEREEGITKVKSFKKIVYENLYDGINVEFFVPEDFNKPVEYNFIVKPEGDISSIKMKISGAEVALKKNSLNMSLIHGNLNEIIPKSWIQNIDGVKEVTINYIEKGENIFGFKTNNNYKKKSILVIDPTPVRQWATYFGGEKDETQYNGDIETDSNGNIFLSGYTRSYNNIATSGSFQNSYTSVFNSWVGYLAKFSSNGSLLWSTYYGNSGASFRGIAIDSQDNIIAVGDTSEKVNIATVGAHQTTLYDDPNNYTDGFFVKFNTNGVRLWGTYYGGESIDGLLGVTTDKNLNIYAVGSTSSNKNISSPGSFREVVNLNVHGNWDSFVVKLNKDGQRQWATYYGGSYGVAIDVDSYGNVYMLGIAQKPEESENISTVGAYQEGYSDEGSMSWTDSFLVKFNSYGERKWGTFFGGDSYDEATGLVVDHSDNIIICGRTRSNVFKTTAAFQPAKGGAYYDWDAYLAKFNSNGQVQWNTFYGGLEQDSGLNVDIDNENNIFLVGETSSSNNIATPDSYQENNIGNDAYVTKFGPSGDRLWGTYYGGESWDSGLDVEIATNGDLYLLGYTFGSSNLATPGAHQETFNAEIDNFLVKFKDCLSSINANATKFLCVGENISFNGSGGTTYAWSGPNGFTSTEQNPIIKNISVDYSGTYSVYIESGDGCNDTRTFEIIVSERPIANPIDNIEFCEDVYSTGISSTIDTSSIESQVLGGQTGMVVRYFDSSGNILPSPLPNPMTNSITNIETITVRVSNDNNLECYAETSFNIIVNPLPNINLIDDIFSCDDDNDGITLFDISNLESNLLGGQTGMLVEYFYENGQQLPSPLPNTIPNIVINQETITARITNPNTNCFNETTFKIIVTPLPIANTLTDLTGCDDNNNGFSEYFDTSNIEALVLGNQTGMVVTYFDNNGDLLPSPLPNPYTNTVANQETITVRVTNSQTNCFSETYLNLITSTKPQINQPQTLFACDKGNGVAYFDTSTIKSQLIGNQTGLLIFYSDENGNQLPSPLPVNYQNTKAWSQKINIRVENELNPLCYSETSFEMIVNELPPINLENDYFLCDLEPSLYIATDSNFDSWKWTIEDGSVISNSFEANLIDAGTYRLQVTKIKNGITCENSFSFNLVRSILPTINEVKIKDISDDNYIEIITSGDGDFEYSIDGLNFQENNTFHNLLGGIYNVQVRDKKGCGTDNKEVVLVGYPKFFTPNNDGFSDYWQIQGIEKFPNTIVYIFDRFGKLLTQLSITDVGWNGTYNGQPLFASDYWFTVDLGDGRNFKGHFSLIR